MFRIAVGSATFTFLVILIILHSSLYLHGLWQKPLCIEEIEEGEEDQEVEQVAVGLQEESVHEVPDSILRW